MDLNPCTGDWICESDVVMFASVKESETGNIILVGGSLGMFGWPCNVMSYQYLEMAIRNWH